MARVFHLSRLVAELIKRLDGALEINMKEKPLERHVVDSGY